MDQNKELKVPSLEEVEAERKRLKRGVHYRKALKGTVAALVVVAAVAVLIATLFLPILQISGDSMEPTFRDGEIVLLFKNSSFDRGDVIGFYYQGKILLKRVIAQPGDTVVVDRDGNVYVNGELLDEPYVTEKSMGDCDLEFPYTVPEESYFVMGDRRSNSVDSRNSLIGCIKSDQVIGRVFLRVWPLTKFSFQ